MKVNSRIKDVGIKSNQIKSNQIKSLGEGIALGSFMQSGVQYTVHSGFSARIYVELIVLFICSNWNH